MRILEMMNVNTILISIGCLLIGNQIIETKKREFNLISIMSYLSILIHQIQGRLSL